jgi:hypothetical protein
MKSAQLLRRARLLVIPAVLAGVVGAVQVGTSSGCLDPNKCYKLIYHPT